MEKLAFASCPETEIMFNSALGAKEATLCKITDHCIKWWDELTGKGRVDWGGTRLLTSLSEAAMPV